ncbi:MAG: hypothetical protein RIM84_20980 [Alphaproteobacteria bacterium]
MATRGQKPKATALHLVEGTLNVTRHRARTSEPTAAGAPIRPTWLGTRAAKFWDEQAAIAWWLTGADSLKLAAWCALSAELSRGVGRMTAARLGQWRALGSELGFDPAGRARLGVVAPPRPPADGADAEPAEDGQGYFDDD